MHAVVVRVSINDPEAATRALQEEVVPMPESVTLDGVEVREVVAHA